MMVIFWKKESHWLGELQQQNLRENHFKILLGNKSDLVDRRAISDASSLAKKYNCEYIETSAKKGDNIDKAFGSVAQNLYNSWKNGGFKEEEWTDEKEKKKKCTLQ